jgi:sigma-B regulation protein RsbU (phosphoserine phosphatase)
MTGMDQPAYQEWSEVALAAEVSLVSPAVDRLVLALRQGGAAADTTEDIRLAVTEALTNAVVHGGGDRSQPLIRLRWMWSGEWLTVEVSEPGRFVPPPDWEELPADPLSESGRGGFLIAQVFPEREHRNADGRHQLGLRRRLGPPLDRTEHESLEQMLAAMTEDLSASYETQSALFQLAEALANADDLGAFLGHVLRVREQVQADGMHLRLVNPEGRLVRRGSGGEALAGPEEIEATGPGAEAAVFRAGSERTVEPGTGLATGDPLHGLGDGAALVCPVYFQERRLGVAVLWRRGTGAFFTAGQVALARTTMEFLGIACVSAEQQTLRRTQLRTQRELEIAAEIQQSLVPREFRARGDWRVHGLCHNALEAGGDFFDVLEVEGGLLLVVGDVMGKGVGAALLAVILRTAVRAHAAQASRPAELLNRIALELTPDLERLGRFITAQLVYAAADGRSLTYANAGHCPLLVQQHGRPGGRLLEEGGLPLGVAREEVYRAQTAALAPGERLLLVTDGLLEAEDPSGRELGVEGLLEIARPIPGGDLGAACRDVLARVRERDGDRPPADDRTLVMLEPVA